MSVVTVKRGFSPRIATLSSVAERLLGALQNETIGAPVVSRLSSTFVADFTAQIALAAKLGADQSGATGSVGLLVQNQAQARVEVLHLLSIARRAARLAFVGQTTLLRSDFQVGLSFPKDLPEVVERGRKVLAACERHASALEPHGWIPASTTALAEALNSLSSLMLQRGRVDDDKLGMTAERLAAANRLYRQCLTVQNVARLVYAGARGLADPASVGARAAFLLGEFPSRALSGVEPAPAGTPTPAAAPSAPAALVGAGS
jgi:hypothetical protein